MHRKRSWAVMLPLLLLLPRVAWAEEIAEPPATPEQEEAPATEMPDEAPPAAETPEAALPELEPEPAPPVAMPSAQRWHYLTRLEATTWALLPCAGRGDDEGFAQIEPTLILDGGPEFGVNVGAPVRLRLWSGEGDSLVRREDWDTLSDWGQLFRGLKFGSDNAPLGVWCGALEEYSLLTGHLVRRYSNRANPDYHPAGGFLTGTLAPISTHPPIAAAAARFGADHPSHPPVRGPDAPRAATPAAPWTLLCPPALSGRSFDEGAGGVDGPEALATAPPIPREVSEGAPGIAPRAECAG